MLVAAEFDVFDQEMKVKVAENFEGFPPHQAPHFGGLCPPTAPCDVVLDLKSTT